MAELEFNLLPRTGMFMIQNADPRADSPECCATQAICISFLCLVHTHDLTHSRRLISGDNSEWISFLGRKWTLSQQALEGRDWCLFIVSSWDWYCLMRIFNRRLTYFHPNCLLLRRVSVQPLCVRKIFILWVISHSDSCQVSPLP